MDNNLHRSVGGLPQVSLDVIENSVQPSHNDVLDNDTSYGGYSTLGIITFTNYVNGDYIQLMFEGLKSEFDVNWSNRTNLLYE